MRKYDKKMKKTLIIIGGLCIGIIIIFSLFLKKAIDIGKTAYVVESGNIVFDKERNKIITQKEGIIKIKWQGDYYLTYDDTSYDLGTNAVVYNSQTNDVFLYGKFYEVTKTGKVNQIKGQNKIKSTENSKFYKLEDRKYLIIDKSIESKDSSFTTSNYLLIDLDKLGNATLLNDKTSFKTITPTTIRTSSYTFDIANEKLNFGGEDIDLKKIIGSTNEYDEETYNLNAENNQDTDGENNNSTGTGTGSGTGSGTATENGTSTGINSDGTTQNSNSNYNNNYNSTLSNSAVQEIINATKNTSIIRTIASIDSISVDYVVYDPNNEYISVYVEIENTSTKRKNTVYLTKTDTNIKLGNLSPNEYYNLTFKYTYYDEAKNLKETTFDNIGVLTKLPSVTLTVTKMTGNKIYYKATLSEKYTITGGTVSLFLNDQFTDITSNFGVKGSTTEITGDDCYLDISNLKLSSNQNIITLKMTSLSFNTYTINPEASYRFKY